MIDAQTQVVGLLGWPLEHSLSPLMHNAAFKALNLNWRYLPLPVRPGQERDAVRGLAALGLRGANVTIPHKQAVLPALDSLSQTAGELRAVNTLIVDYEGAGGPRIHGENTDHSGFLRALLAGGFQAGNGQRAVVAGAGGAARAVVYSLLSLGLEEVVVLNRSLAHAQTLVTEIGGLRPWKTRLEALPFTTGALLETSRRADLLVNTTPVGTWPETEASIWPGREALPANLFVFDLVYNPIETRLLQQARRSKARAINGVEMLVQQGALAFEMWCGMAAPLGVMRAACKRALRR